MSYDYFRDLNKYFGTLHWIKNSWYEHRGNYSEEQQKKMFQIFQKISDRLVQLGEIARSPALGQDKAEGG